MDDCWRSPRALKCACFLTCVLLLAAAAASSPESDDARAIRQMVAVGVVGHGQAIVLATSGLANGGRVWRFRSFDTSDLPQPIRSAVLAASGTKLFLQSDGSRGGVLDLTRQHRHNAPLQYVSSSGLATGGRGQVHRLASQRFVSVDDGVAYVIDDVGQVQLEYPPMPAVQGAVTADGVVLYLKAGGTVAVCGEQRSPSACRELATSLDGASTIVASSLPLLDGQESPRFLAIAREGNNMVLLDPETGTSSGGVMSRTEASLRACLMLHRMSMTDAGITSMTHALIRESAKTLAAAGQPITDWHFFRVKADEELYAPVLQFARRETVFPTTFGMLEGLGKGVSLPAGSSMSGTLYDRYLRFEVDALRERCTFYYRTHSTPGSWIIEYWLYYPFDVGGLGSHPHDPEHIFVEVDKLGGAPRRVIGAGHGYMAGNNMYTADRAGARAISLPLFAIVELGKHASAPDIDRDGMFTPGIDENEYDERAKVWGVRDVIGTINNQLLAYDSTMNGARRPNEFLALASTQTRFPDDPDIAGHATCRLEPIADETPARRSLFRLSDWILLPPCHDLTSDCAKLHITAHPDFIDVRTILKEWAFPSSFLRASYWLGPRKGMYSVGAGYGIDLDRIPGLGRILPLPGRIGVDGLYWHQDINDDDKESCIGQSRDDNGNIECNTPDGVGLALRYEQFLSNLFGVFSAIQFYNPGAASESTQKEPGTELWITFGPFIETPIGRRSNVLLAGGLSFRQYSSPRFELKISVGLWKPKTNHIGMRAGTDRSR